MLRHMSSSKSCSFKFVFSLIFLGVTSDPVYVLRRIFLLQAFVAIVAKHQEKLVGLVCARTNATSHHAV
jgi:hypothetical protein